MDLFRRFIGQTPEQVTAISQGDQNNFICETIQYFSVGSILFGIESKPEFNFPLEEKEKCNSPRFVGLAWCRDLLDHGSFVERQIFRLVGQLCWKRNHKRHG